ncbi:hypothetical protein WG66_011056 [Moniliophthora roreri]|nr:hypothetical protein WG66_011056 [Moniliophthora roreri]
MPLVTGSSAIGIKSELSDGVARQLMLSLYLVAAFWLCHSFIFERYTCISSFASANMHLASVVTFSILGFIVQGALDLVQVSNNEAEATNVNAV